MKKSDAERAFIEKLIDFCRTHRIGKAVHPALAKEAIHWENVFGMELRTTLDIATKSPLGKVRKPIIGKRV